ncbi:MAG TPA: alpha-glucosidase, partial [Leeuwenhoekiella sp.]|nr:alpha-glucosidase [Leeuwenhoekiella sp.]
PWAFGEEIEQVSRTAINRRYRLLPYLYTLFHEASQTGMPIMRPAFFADITDISLREEQQSFLLGEDLMVIPQWAEDLKMPQGDWQDLTLEENTDKYQATVKLRDGAILPVGPVIQSTVDYSTSEITLFINLDAEGKASGSLYDDAGEGYGYQSGDYSILDFEATTVDGQVEVHIEQTEGSRTMDRKFKIALVQDGAIKYSEWQSGDTIRLN